MELSSIVQLQACQRFNRPFVALTSYRCYKEFLKCRKNGLLPHHAHHSVPGGYAMRVAGTSRDIWSLHSTAAFSDPTKRAICQAVWTCPMSSGWRSAPENAVLIFRNGTGCTGCTGCTVPGVSLGDDALYRAGEFERDEDHGLFPGVRWKHPPISMKLEFLLKWVSYKYMWHMLVLVIWILLLVFIDVDSIQTVSIILIRFDVFSPFFFPSAH